MILECLSVALAVTLLGSLLVTAARNYEKQQFFRKKSPNLPVAESPRLFGGHANTLVHGKYNYLKVEELLEQHGPTFGFYYGSKPAAVTVDLDFIKTFAIDEVGHVNRMLPDLPIEEIEQDSIIFAFDEQWQRLRRAIAPAFSAHKIKTTNVRAQIDCVIDQFVGLIELRLQQAKEERGEDFIVEDADDICQRYAIALVFNCFYKQSQVIDFRSSKDKYVELVKCLTDNLVSNFIRICAAFPSLKPMVNWLILNFSEQGVVRNTIMDYIKQQTRLHFEARRQAKLRERPPTGGGGAAAADREPSKNPDGSGAVSDMNNFTMDDGSKFKLNMVDYIIDQYREGKLTEREFYNSTFFLFFAANKTSSDAITKVLYHLALHQDVQAKLRQSIMAEGMDSEYLTWVVLESMRLFPPAPIGCSRALRRDIQTKHGLVPAGTFVVTPTYTISRLPEYWGEDANEFRPERWADSKNFHPCQYLIFGAGRRSCPGKDLALLETKMLVNALLRRYQFDASELNDPSNRFNSPMFIFLVFEKPTYLKISRLVS